MKFITQSYLTLLGLFLFLNTFSVFINDFFQIACLQASSQQTFNVNKLYYVILQSSFYIRFFWVQVFQSPGFSGSESRVWVQVLEVAQLQCVNFYTLKKKNCENTSKVHKIHRYTIIKDVEVNFEALSSLVCIFLFLYSKERKKTERKPIF